MKRLCPTPSVKGSAIYEIGKRQGQSFNQSAKAILICRCGTTAFERAKSVKVLAWFQAVRSLGDCAKSPR